MDSGDRIRSERLGGFGRKPYFRMEADPSAGERTSMPEQGNPPSDHAVRSNYSAGFVRRLAGIAAGART
jgi:hypothetical protein